MSEAEEVDPVIRAENMGFNDGYMKGWRGAIDRVIPIVYENTSGNPEVRDRIVGALRRIQKEIGR